MNFASPVTFRRSMPGDPKAHSPSPFRFGDLWMWLHLMWLHFEVVRGPVGVVWGRFGSGLGPFGPQTGSKSTPNDPDRTSDNLTLQPHELQPHPWIAESSRQALAEG